MAPLIGCGIGVGFGGAVAPWTPDKESGLIGWYKWNDPAITLVTGKVSAWPGWLSYGPTVTQADAAKRPVQGAAGIEFRVADVTYLSAAAPIDTGIDYTIAIAESVSVASPVAGYGAKVMNGRADGGTGYGLFTSPSTPALLTQVHSGRGIYAPVAESAATSWVLTSQPGATTVGRIVKNGSAYTSVAGLSDVAATPDSQFSIGAAEGGAYPCSSNMLEVVIYNHQLSATVEANLGAYLAREHGI